MIHGMTMSKLHPNGLSSVVARDMLEKYNKYWIDITKINQLLFFVLSLIHYIS